MKRRQERVAALSRGVLPSELPCFTCDRCGADLNADAELFAMQQWTESNEKRITETVRGLPSFVASLVCECDHDTDWVSL